ncbi:MAG: DegT/DnrJ/EryC1/StrS family aminotransferase [Ilumatobacteraceae bacterium]
MTAPEPIPLVDLRAQHDEVATEVLAGFAEVLDATAFIGGPQVGAFEQEFAQYCGTTHCVGAANGTDAIELVLRALDIGRGDEVVVPANTFIATAEAVDRTGARVVLVDCSEATLLIDPRQVAEKITSATRAIIGVDLYGQIAPFDELATVVDTERICLVEDAAQSQGAVRKGSGIGAAVAAAATSFYPGKNLGAYGDAGAVVCNDESLADRVRAIGGHGGLRRYEHDLIGFNSRLDTLQAVVLRAKLRRLDGWNECRRNAAARYDELLDGVDAVQRLGTAPGNTAVWHLYPIRVADRDRVLAALHRAGIGAGIHYPQPIHLTGAFESLGYTTGDFPVAERAASSLLSLPIHPHITPEQQVRVVETLRGAIT